MTMEMDIDASVPMLRMYCRCTGETLRKAEKLRSTGVPEIGFRVGTRGDGW